MCSEKNVFEKLVSCEINTHSFIRTCYKMTHFREAHPIFLLYRSTSARNKTFMNYIKFSFFIYSCVSFFIGLHLFHKMLVDKWMIILSFTEQSRNNSKTTITLTLNIDDLFNLFVHKNQHLVYELYFW